MNSFQDILPPVRDQGLRSTCLSIALSDGHLIARRTGPVLSPEHLHFQATRRVGFGPNDAIPLSAGRDTLSQDGQTSESDCPYSPLPRPPAWTPVGNLSQVWRRSTLSFHSDILRLVREDLAGGTTCVLLLTLNDAFIAGPPQGGTIDVVTGPDRGHHAVLPLEITTSPGAILIRNCWGTGWGDGGHAWVSEAFLVAKCFGIVRFSGALP